METLNVAGRASLWRSVLDTLTSVAIIAAAGAVGWANIVKPRLDHPNPTRVHLPIPSEPVSISTLPTRGKSSAKVALIEYSDFQCPFCARFAEETQPSIQREYVDTGRVLIVFRHLPLQQIHPFADTAARGAVCAAEQGKFWEMHDALFAMKGALGPTTVQTLAAKLGLNNVTFDACLSTRADVVVRQDIATARVLGTTGTPTFLVGRLLSDRRVQVTTVISGSEPLSAFQQALETALR